MPEIDFSKYQLNAQFFYSSTIYMLHYAPQHVRVVSPVPTHTHTHTQNK